MFRILLIATLSLTTEYKMGGLQELIDKVSPKAQKVAEKAQGDALMTMDYVKGNEGYSAEVYDDTENLKTIAYGFNLEDETTRGLLPSDVVSGKRKITREEADDAFGKRFEMAMSDAVSFIGGKGNFSKLTPSQKKAVIDMSYNMGLPRLNKFTKLREALVTGNKLQAKSEVLNSKYAQSDVPNRALKNANLMLK